MVTRTISLGLFVLFAAGCDVDDPPESTGGVDFGQSRGAKCERGVVVVESDYKSTNIALSTLEGVTLSGSFISSGASKPGLSLAISGDVDVPSLAPASGRLVLLDRFGTNVITWLDTATAKVLAQLPVGQNFESNPHDYIEVDAQRAFVSRFGSNPKPGAAEFDAGGDLLIIDTQKPAILGRIAMPEEDPVLKPRPSGINRLGSELIVTLSRAADDYSKYGDGRFVGVSPTSNSVVWTVDLKGLSGCGRVEVSPDGTRLAVACSSNADATTSKYDPTMSDVVLFDATLTPPKELKRFGLGIELNSGIQPALAFVNDSLLFIKTYGGNASPGDRALSLDIATGTVSGLADAQGSFMFSGLRCSAGCTDICVLTDGEKSVLRRFQFASTGLATELAPVTVETVIGLPPRSLGGI